jgi:hypothetical protein
MIGGPDEYILTAILHHLAVYYSKQNRTVENINLAKCKILESQLAKNFIVRKSDHGELRKELY